MGNRRNHGNPKLHNHSSDDVVTMIKDTQRLLPCVVAQGASGFQSAAEVGREGERRPGGGAGAQRRCLGLDAADGVQYVCELSERKPSLQARREYYSDSQKYLATLCEHEELTISFELMKINW